MALTPITAGEIVNIPLGQITPDPGQPRKHFDEDALQQLADDIALRGVQQPISIIAAGDDGYYIKDGERRWRASKLANKAKVPCILAAAEKGPNKPLVRLFDQIALNNQRQPLNDIDWAHTFARMRDEFGLTPTGIEKACKEHNLRAISRSHIANTLRLLDLPGWAQNLIGDGTLTARHGLALHPAVGVEPVLGHVAALIDRGVTDLSATNIRQHVHQGFAKHYPQLDEKLVDAGRLKKHRADLQLKKVTRPWGNEDDENNATTFVLNSELWERLVAETAAARNAGLTSKGETTGEDDGDEDGPADNPVGAPDLDPDDDNRHWRLSQAAHYHLRDALLQALDTEQRQNLGLWAAFGEPRQDVDEGSWWCDAGDADDTFGEVYAKAGLGTPPPIHAGHWLQATPDVRAALLDAAARYAIDGMTEHQCVEVAHGLGWTTAAHVPRTGYRLHSSYLQALTLAELDALAHDLIVDIGSGEAIENTPAWASARSRDAKRAVLETHADLFTTLPDPVAEALAELWEEHTPKDDDDAGEPA